ncbi:hypothetical protein GK047_03150 [Paenibacillus sp. SYP-B3998]|uniref:Uncharacterized protein n=1 Tax=Paenibacillus sp. SYP-B3998 TaxID=2678564 RepID=A0A6G3ZS27_9BACL|nr:hypothetical protein [Paenibacillus sp. SYP-B3998]NEW05016.1 hypothetical protein [Paenibacillus sp. SYP-B3998]
MMTVRFAKSKLENEEGMNHLWIQIASIGEVEDARIQIVLPVGIHRMPNLTLLPEAPTGEILLKDLTSATDLFIEILTRGPVPCGQTELVFALSCKDKQGNGSRIEQVIPLTIADEDGMDNVLLDDEVVKRIKQLQQPIEGCTHNQRIDYVPRQIVKIDSNLCSDLEKKYRIDGLAH